MIKWNGYKLNSITVNGNSKIGENVYHFSTTPGGSDIGGTCPFKCPDCYGFEGKYNCDNVKKGLAIRTEIARNDLDFLYAAISAEIEKFGIEYFRTHVTGDYFSIPYVDMWETIVNEHKNTNFWSYTKSENQYGPDFDKALAKLNSHNNMNIVPSVIPGKGFNFGKCDYILKLYKYLLSIGEDVYICPCGTDNTVHCNSCHGCSKHKFVLFLLHGVKTYNAKKDILFPAIAEIVANQAK